MPALNFPTVELPKIDLPEIDADRVAAVARDAAYIAVGFGILAFQKAQVRRQELVKQLNVSKLPVDQISKFIGDQIRDLDGQLVRLEAKVDGIVDQVKDRLPSPADDFVGQVQGVAKAATKQVREFAAKAA